jgi:diguanylate cyclase (GGDEF)-like protein
LWWIAPDRAPGGLAVLGLALVPPAACAAVTARRAGRERMPQRLDWLALGAAAITGGMLLAVRPWERNGARVLHVAVVVVAAIAVTRLLRRASGQDDLRSLLDVTVGALGRVGAALVGLAAPVSDGWGVPAWRLPGYLGGVAVVVAVALGVTVGRRAGTARRAPPALDAAAAARVSRADAARILLALFVAVVALVDVLLAAREPRSPVALALELAWGSAAVFVAALTRGRLPEGVLAVDPPPPRALTLADVGALAGLGVLVAGPIVTVPAAAVGLAGASLLLAGARANLAAVQARRVDESRREARTDDLTGLPNRRAFYEHLHHSLQGRPESHELAVLVVDLDRFKEINDSLGHVAGDDLLRLIAARLEGRLARGELLARLGGDEFGLVVEGTEVRARAVARRLRRQLDAPFEVAGLTLRAEASIGIARWPEHGPVGERLLARADIAMYRAKAARSGVETYRQQNDGPSRERLASIEALRAALPRSDIVLHYQPKIDVRTGRTVGVEALARWRRHDRLVSPAAFIPLAEQAGLLPELTRVVLDDSLAQLRRWQLRGVPVSSVAVNVSASCLLAPGFPSRVARALARAGQRADRLTIEITEDTVVSDPERCQRVLAELRREGVRLSLDDYGTGYSSLSMLRQLSLDELKLDRSFGLAADADARAGAIVRSTAGLARALGLSLVVEGVETVGTLALLRESGCDVAQGFLFAQPLPAAELESWLADHEVRSGVHAG